MKSRWQITAILLFPFMANANTVDWKSVGSGTMRWTLFELYDIRLLTETGRYDPNSYPQALEITYRRDIPAERLVEATQDQWQHLDLSLDNQKTWLTTLETLWPDVRKNDTLRFEAYQTGENLFIHNGKSLGSVSDSGFARAFLNIWLSPDTSQPRLRKLLIDSSS